MVLGKWSDTPNVVWSKTSIILFPSSCEWRLDECVFCGLGDGAMIDFKDGQYCPDITANRETKIFIHCGDWATVSSLLLSFYLSKE